MYARSLHDLLVESCARDAKRAIAYFVWADRCAVVAIAMFVLAPALVLYAINLTNLGSIALAVWLVYIGVMLAPPGGRR